MKSFKFLWIVILSVTTTVALQAQNCNDFTLSGTTTAVSCNSQSDGSIDLNLPCTPGGGGSGVNLALNATVSQSSTSGTAEAALATDGNTSGFWYIDYTVASTNWSFDSYWTADLGAVYNIDEIEIWGRTDCCQNFVTEYYVFVSDSPFTTTSVNATQNAAGVTTFTKPGPAAAPNTVPVATSGRYVRIQLSNPGLLQMAEVVIKEASGGGGCDLTINWDSGLGNVEDPQNLSAGTYNVTVSSTDGCMATENFVVAPAPDADNDGVCDSEDRCAGFDDNLDTDGDGIPDGCDNVINCGTFVGDVILTSQAEVDAFDNCYVRVDGKLSVYSTILNTPNDIINLSTLNGIKEITGSIEITGTSLNNLSDLSELMTIGEGLNIQNNPDLINFIGLEKLTAISGTVTIRDNPLLANLKGLNNITQIMDDFELSLHPSLTEITDLSNIETINGRLIVFNTALLNLSGLENLTILQDGLNLSLNNNLSNIDALRGIQRFGVSGANSDIIDNAALTNLDGLSGVTQIDGYLVIRNNDALSDISALTSLTTVEILTLQDNAALSDCCSITHLIDDDINNGTAGSVSIRDNNAQFCNSTADILLNCQEQPICDDFSLNGSATDVSCANSNDGSINLILPCTSGGSGGGTTNLALNKTATQSATLGAATADLAVDGGTSGEWFVDYSVASTTWGTQSWWEVDLGASANISEIEVWGRTDCCQDFLTNYHILVSENPFTSTNLNATIAQSGVSDFLEPGPAGAPNTTAINTSGRYVRVQLQGSGLLQLAEVIVKGSGGSSTNCDLTINWDSGLGSVEDPQGLSAGTYRVTVSNTEGCSTTKAFTVNEPANALNCSASVTQQITTNGDSNGRATASATGGTTPYTYEWSNNTTNTTATNLRAGNYTVTITDVNGCTCTASVTLNEPAGCNLTATAAQTQAISTPDGTDGKAKATPVGGTSPYTYNWSNGGATATISNLAAGTYNVTVTDADNCTATASVSLAAPNCNLGCTASIVQTITNPNGSDGQITVNTTGGATPLTYNWSNNSTTKTINNLNAGTYEVTVTDANNCTCTSSITLTNPSVNGLNLNCPGNITIFATSGTGATVNWNEPTAITDCTEGGSGSCPETVANFSYAGELGDSKYFLSGYKTFWADAKSDCEDAGGHLAIIETEEENIFVKNLINQAHFIGLTDQALEGTYKWVDGTAPTFTKFGSYQPNSATKDYVILNNWGNGTWSHATGSVYKFFILEVPCSSDGININQIAGLSSGSTFPVGTSNVTYQAEDACNNMQSCTFSVTVQQPTSSISLSCPNNITVMQTTPDGADVSWNAPTATTTCTMGGGNATITQTAGNASGSRFEVGTTVISYQAQDACGASSSCSFTITVTPDDSATLPSGYCDSRGEQPWFEWIARFTLGSIDNGPPTNFKEGRGNFILQSTNVQPGGTYPFTIEPSFSYLPQTEYFRIWIDFNRDADFDDAGEMVFETTDNQIINSSVTIPNTVSTGATLLRIAIRRDAYPEPCDTYTYGEVEDYSVVIGGSAPIPLSINNQGELLTLEATKDAEEVTLEWLNNTGPVNEIFMVERSANGRDYEVIAELNAYESTGKPQFLSTIDTKPLEGSNFYRVKLLYDDGAIRYSDYRHVNVHHVLPFSIYPNPARGQTTLDLSQENGKMATVQIFNHLGQFVQELQTTDNQLILPLEAYQNGVYWIYVDVNGRRSIGQKMVVVRMY